MSGGPPPGYNPSDSLLSGGTSAQIVPVMGGGGGAPENYNAGASLLHGGETAQIHPVMGGGATQEGGQSRDEDLVILGFPPGAAPSKDEIRKAYRKKALTSHPNKGGSAAEFQELGAAYERLSGENAPAPPVGPAAGLAAPSNADNANWNAARDLAGQGAAAENVDENWNAARDKAAAAAAAENAAAAAPTPVSAKDMAASDLMIEIKGVQDQIDELTKQVALATKPEDKEALNKQISALSNKKATLDKQLEALKISPFAPSGPKKNETNLTAEGAWLEYYYVDDKETPIQTPVYGSERTNIEMGNSKELKSMIQVYTSNQKKLWQRVSNEGVFLSSANQTITMKRCATTGRFGSLESSGFHRLVRIVPSTTETVIVIPPLRGNIGLLNAALDQLFSFGYINKAIDGTAVLRDNTELVFSAPIYALNEADASGSIFSLGNNALILYTILKLKNMGGEHVTALADYRQESMIAGCMLNYYGSAVRRPETENSEDPLANMLEPSYVIYPWKRDRFDGIVLSASLGAEATLPTTKGTDTAMTLSNYLKASYLSNFYTINPGSSAPNDSLIDNYLKFRCFGEIGEPAMDIPNRKEPDPSSSCRNLYSAVELKELSTSQVRYMTYAQLEKDAAIKSPMMMIFRLLPTRRGLTGFEPSCESTGDSLRTVALQRLKMFTPAKITVPPSQDMKDITVGSRTYEIRALAPGQTDWANLIFTEEEADLLNDLNLRPSILEDVFSTANWRNMLDRFLKSLVSSNCFEDKYLLTRKECLNAREFITAVHNYFMLNDSRLAETFRDEDEALQNTDLFLRQSKANDELSSMKEAQAQVDQLSTLDPDVVDSKLLAEMEPGAFRDNKMWGDARADPITQLGTAADTKDVFKFPILLVNKKTDEYRLRAIVITADRGTMTKEQAMASAELAYANLKVKYPGWKFLM